MTIWITEILGFKGHDQLIQFRDQMGREFVMSRRVLNLLNKVGTTSTEAPKTGLEITHWDQVRDRVSQLTGKTCEQIPNKKERPILKLVWDAKKVDRD